MFGPKKPKTTSIPAPTLSAPTEPQVQQQDDDAVVHVRDVFSTAAVPPRSFVDRDWYPEIVRLKTALGRDGVVTCIWGESKSGKTTFLRRQLLQRSQPYVFVLETGFRSLEHFWRSVGETLRVELVKLREHAQGTEESISLSARVEGEVSSGFAKIASSVETEGVANRIANTVFATEPVESIRSKCLDFLKATRTTIAIDDFHKIDEKVRVEIAFDLRPALDANQALFVFVGVGEDAFGVFEKRGELQGRFRLRPFPNWTLKDLQAVAERGFNLLGQRVTGGQINMICKNAVLNPYNLQDICLNICDNAGIRSSCDVREGQVLETEVLSQSLQDFAVELKYFHQILDRVVGPSRTTLTTYSVEKQQLNIFELALLALADSGGRISNISLLRKKIRKRLGDATWSGTHLRDALQRLAKTGIDIEHQKETSNRGSFPILYHYREKEDPPREDQVSVTNPLFRVYLYWYLPSKLGVTGRDLAHLAEIENEVS